MELILGYNKHTVYLFLCHPQPSFLNPSVVKEVKIVMETMNEAFEGFAMEMVSDSFDGIVMDSFQDADTIQEPYLNKNVEEMVSDSFDDAVMDSFQNADTVQESDLNKNLEEMVSDSFDGAVMDSFQDADTLQEPDLKYLEEMVLDSFYGAVMDSFQDATTIQESDLNKFLEKDEVKSKKFENSATLDALIKKEFRAIELVEKAKKEEANIMLRIYLDKFY